LYASPPLPPYNISVGKHTSDEMYDRLKTLFLNLNGTSVWHQEVIHSLDRDYTGFSATDDEEYKIVRELIQPFE
jgi:ABC-type phosphate/phosphonate transport system substrate-binding protein